MRINRVVLVAGVVAAGLAGPATAQPTVGVDTVRGSRRVSMGLSLAWPWTGQDFIVPLPAWRLGVNFSPRLAMDFTAGTLQYSAYGGFSMLDIGGRWFLFDAKISPYLMGRAGAYFVDGDESPDRTYRYATLGAGFEYACVCGFTAWAELGPALIESGRGGYASVGVGYRFQSTSQR